MGVECSWKRTDSLTCLPLNAPMKTDLGKGLLKFLVSLLPRKFVSFSQFHVRFHFFLSPKLKDKEWMLQSFSVIGQVWPSEHSTLACFLARAAKWIDQFFFTCNTPHIIELFRFCGRITTFSLLNFFLHGFETLYAAMHLTGF